MMNERPGMLTFVCISAILLGLLGGMAVLGQIVGLVIGEAMQQAADDVTVFPLAVIQVETADENQNSESTGEVAGADTAATDSDEAKALNPAEFQLEIQKSAMKVAKKWRTTSLIFAAIQAVVAVLLFLGGIMGLSRKPLGRTMMLMGFAGAIGLVVVRFYPNYMIQKETMSVVSEQMDAMMDAMPKNGGNAPPNPAGFMELASTLSLVFSVVWSLVLCGFSVWFFLYLQGKSAKNYFFPHSTENEFGFQDGGAA